MKKKKFRKITIFIEMYVTEKFRVEITIKTEKGLQRKFGLLCCIKTIIDQN